MTELKKERKKQGFTQVELAKRVGVSLMTIQLWERGVTTPKEENRVKLKKVLEGTEKKESDSQ